MSAASERRLLGGLLERSQELSLAYRSALSGGRLGPSQALGRLFGDQDGRHADALGAALRRLGGSPPPGPSSPGDVRGLSSVLAGDRATLLAFLAELEQRSIRALLRAHGELRTPALLATCAGVMANEAQHLALLRQELGRDPSPVAFVTGRG